MSTPCPCRNVADAKGFPDTPRTSLCEGVAAFAAVSGHFYVGGHGVSLFGFHLAGIPRGHKLVLSLADALVATAVA